MNKTEDASSHNDNTARSLIIVVAASVVVVAIDSIFEFAFVDLLLLSSKDVRFCGSLKGNWKKAGRAIQFKMSDSVLARADSFDVLNVTLDKQAGWAKQMSVVNSVNGVSHRCEITAWTKKPKNPPWGK
jgi:hypothetical protein